MTTTTKPTPSLQARLWTVEDSLLRAVLLYELRVLSDYQNDTHTKAGQDLSDTIRKLAYNIREARYHFNQEYGL